MWCKIISYHFSSNSIEDTTVSYNLCTCGLQVALIDKIFMKLIKHSNKYCTQRNDVCLWMCDQNWSQLQLSQVIHRLLIKYNMANCPIPTITILDAENFMPPACSYIYIYIYIAIPYYSSYYILIPIVNNNLVPVI